MGSVASGQGCEADVIGLPRLGRLLRAAASCHLRRKHRGLAAACRQPWGGGYWPVCLFACLFVCVCVCVFVVCFVCLFVWLVVLFCLGGGRSWGLRGCGEVVGDLGSWALEAGWGWPLSWRPSPQPCALRWKMRMMGKKPGVDLGYILHFTSDSK